MATFGITCPECNTDQQVDSLNEAEVCRVCGKAYLASKGVQLFYAKLFAGHYAERLRNGRCFFCNGYLNRKNECRNCKKM